MSKYITDANRPPHATFCRFFAARQFGYIAPRRTAASRRLPELAPHLPARCDEDALCPGCGEVTPTCFLATGVCPDCDEAWDALQRETLAAG